MKQGEQAPKLKLYNNVDFMDDADFCESKMEQPNGRTSALPD